MAEAIAKRIIERRGLPLTASSMGCGALDGSPASYNSSAVCAENGLDITSHRAHQITKEDDTGTRAFVCMTARHEAFLSSLGIGEDKLFLFDRDIPDPYGGDISVYENCFSELDKAVGRILFRLAPLPDGVTVRDMTQEDVPAAAQLERECFSQPWSEKALSEELCTGCSVLLIAEKDGETAGYIGMQHTGVTGYITNVAVSEKYRRFGVGSALVREMTERARALGESEITLEVRSKNAGAIELYLRAGFENMGKRPGFYTEPDDDAVIMTARLL